MCDEIVILAVATPKTDYYEACKKALLSLQGLTLKEPGCLQFDILENKENDGKLYFYERFTGRESFDLHFTYDYTKKVFEDYKVWLAQDIEIIHLKMAV